MCLDAMEIVKEALIKENLLDKVYLICQPCGYHTPDAGKGGFIGFAECPFALEPRVCTRWDMHAFARRAYEMGIR